MNKPIIGLCAIFILGFVTIMILGNYNKDDPWWGEGNDDNKSQPLMEPSNMDNLGDKGTPKFILESIEKDPVDDGTN